MKKKNKPSVSNDHDPLSSQERGQGVSSIEITHDILAKKIYARIDADEKMRLKITQMLRDRYTYYQETGELLSKRDLAYIDPYISLVEKGEIDWDFVNRSRKIVKTKENKRWIIIGSIGIALCLALFVSIWFGFKANQEERKAKDAEEVAIGRLDSIKTMTKVIVTYVLDDALQDIYKLRYEEAAKKFEDACKLELGNQKEKVINGMIELAYFYYESEKKDKAIDMLKKVNEIKVSDGKPGFIDDLNLYEQPIFDKVLYSINNTYYNELVEKYYPSMKKIRDKDSIGITEVTIWQYGLYCSATKNGSMESIKERLPWGLNGDNPVVNVSWLDAIKYINWLNKKRGLDSTYSIAGDKVSIRKNIAGFRLPKVEFWKYCAKANENTKFSGSDTIDLIGWYYVNSGGRTQGVKLKQPNAFGLYDMTGNAWEWCEDYYGNSLSLHVAIGGGWDGLKKGITIENSSYMGDLKKRYNTRGFRISR